MVLASKENHFCLLLSNTQEGSSSFEILCGWGLKHEISTNSFETLKEFNSKAEWSFGYIGYDMKNDVELLTSKKTNSINKKDSSFFIPQYVLKFVEGEIKIYHDDDQSIDNIIGFLKQDTLQHQENTTVKLNIRPRETFSEYLKAVTEIKKHIKKGDIYEANYCTEFFDNEATIDPCDLYMQLNAYSPTPFSAFLKLNDVYCLSASPERFLKKENLQVVSQPIKGTARRSTNPEKDKTIKSNLKVSLKDQSENIMIVDLVRNDLARTAIKDSVKVEELCQVYSFPQVHQMISTISSKVTPETNNIDIIKSMFPPGSMTGAPKVKAMELMEQYEKSNRGIYSGAIGYFNPNGDFDFNVVIRSILYNATNKYLSFMVGGAITDNSIPEQEYEECILKAKAILNTLGIDENVFLDHDRTV